MSMITSDMVHSSVEFFETELDCSGNIFKAVVLEYVDDGLNNALRIQLEEEVKKLVTRRKGEICETIEAHLEGHNLNRCGLAEFVRSVLKATNLTKIYKKHVDPFLNDGFCKSKEVRLALLDRLELSESDISLKTPEFVALSEKLGRLKFVQFNYFLRHFDLIWANREIICATPELSNITFDGVGGGLAYIGPFHITLGQLLNLYNRGSLRLGTCEVCHCKQFVYSYSGSPLSGCGQYSVFCPMCHKTRYINSSDVDVSERVWRHFLAYNLPFGKYKSRWTVTTLVHALDPNLALEFE